MKIDGFSIGKNASKLFYPIKQSIMSVLPIVDNFIIALGKGDEDDFTRKEIESINSPKIKIINTIWETEKFPGGMEHARQTDIAKSYCTGDWLFYLQADEVIHEKDLPLIQKCCNELIHDKEVEGFVLKYTHFWGDYWHYQRGHCWYNEEIRIIRNHPDIHSWQSAQSFRRIPAFNGLNYRQKKETFKLKVAAIDATVYHYGWVRPPDIMQKKNKSFNLHHLGIEEVEKQVKLKMYDELFDYGNINKLSHFKTAHPGVMKGWIDKFNWENQLRRIGPARSYNKLKLKHDLLKYRVISWIEKNLLFGLHLGEFRNFVLIKKCKF